MPVETSTGILCIDGVEIKTNTFEIEEIESEYTLKDLIGSGIIEFKCKGLKKFFKRLRFPKKQRRRNNRLFRKK